MVSKVRLIQAGVVVILLGGLIWGARSLTWNREDEALVTWRAPEETNAPAPAPKEEVPKVDLENSVSAEDLLAAGGAGHEAKAPVADCPACPPCPAETAPEPEPAKAEPPAAEVVTVKTEAPPPREWGNATSQLTQPHIQLLAREKQSFWGYLPNDLVVGKVLDNGRSRQEGELFTLRPLIAFLAETSTPKANDPAAALRENFLDADLAQYWFTSGETRISRTIKALQALGAGLGTRQIKLTASPDNLREILARATDVLAEEELRLSGETGLLDVDNVFYHAQGSALAAAEIIAAVDGSFGPAIEQAHIKADLKSAAGSLGEAAALDPWMVMGDNADFIGRNHLARLASLLGDARASLLKAASRLPAPEPASVKK